MLLNYRFAPGDKPAAKIRAAAIFFAVLLLMPPGTVHADYLDIVPSLGVKQEYADNLFYTVNKTGDLITTFSPGVDFQRQTERLNAHLSGTVKGIKYWHKTQYDTVDYSFLGRTQYQLSPRLDLTASAAYDRFSGPSLNANSLFIALDTVRHYQQIYSLSGEYRLTANTSATATYSYTQNQYVSVPLQSQSRIVTPPVVEPPPPPTPQPPPTTTTPSPDGDGKPPVTRYVDSADARVHAASLSMAHSFTPRTKGTLVAGYSDFLYKFSTTENYELTAGLSHTLNELWTVSVSAGERHTISQGTRVLRSFTSATQFTDALQPRTASDSWGWVGQGSLVYNDETWGGSLSANRNVSQGRIGANESTGVTLELHDRFTYELQGSLFSSYVYDKAKSGEFGSSPVSDQTVRVGGGLHYDFTKDVSLEGGYAIGLANVAGVRVTQNNAYLNFVVNYPLFN